MKGLTTVALVIAVALGYYLFRRTTPAAPSAAIDPPPVVARASPDLGSTPAATGGLIDHAQRLASKAARQQLADRIVAAQAARAAGRNGAGRAAVHAARPPTLPSPTLDPDRPDDFKATIRATVKDAIPLLAGCYEAAMPQLPDESHLEAKLTLISDPDVGTIIDAHQIQDDRGAPILATFDDCLRDTMQQLALPPLAHGGTIDVTYPFTFSKR